MLGQVLSWDSSWNSIHCLRHNSKTMLVHPEWWHNTRLLSIWVVSCHHLLSIVVQMRRCWWHSWCTVHIAIETLLLIWRHLMRSLISHRWLIVYSAKLLLWLVLISLVCVWSLLSITRLLSLTTFFLVSSSLSSIIQSDWLCHKVVSLALLNAWCCLQLRAKSKKAITLRVFGHWIRDNLSFNQARVFFLKEIKQNWIVDILI